MGCCNKAPKGGANLGLLLKLIAGIFVVLLIASYWQ